MDDAAEPLTLHREQEPITGAAVATATPDDVDDNGFDQYHRPNEVVRINTFFTRGDQALNERQISYMALNESDDLDASIINDFFKASPNARTQFIMWKASTEIKASMTNANANATANVNDGGANEAVVSKSPNEQQPETDEKVSGDTDDLELTPSACPVRRRRKPAETPENDDNGGEAVADNENSRESEMQVATVPPASSVVLGAALFSPEPMSNTYGGAGNGGAPVSFHSPESEGGETESEKMFEKSAAEKGSTTTNSNAAPTPREQQIIDSSAKAATVEMPLQTNDDDSDATDDSQSPLRSPVSPNRNTQRGKATGKRPATVRSASQAGDAKRIVTTPEWAKRLVTAGTPTTALTGMRPATVRSATLKKKMNAQPAKRAASAKPETITTSKSAKRPVTTGTQVTAPTGMRTATVSSASLAGAVKKNTPPVKRAAPPKPETATTSQSAKRSATAGTPATAWVPNNVTYDCDVKAKSKMLNPDTGKVVPWYIVAWGDTELPRNLVDTGSFAGVFKEATTAQKKNAVSLFEQIDDEKRYIDGRARGRQMYACPFCVHTIQSRGCKYHLRYHAYPGIQKLNRKDSEGCGNYMRFRKVFQKHGMPIEAGTEENFPLESATTKSGEALDVSEYSLTFLKYIIRPAKDANFLHDVDLMQAIEPFGLSAVRPFLK